MSAHADLPVLTIENTSLPQQSLWRKLPIIGIVAGIGLLALAYVLGSGGGEQGDSAKQFYASYLTSLSFWVSIGLGAMFFVLIQHGTRAGWGIVVRRIAENWMATLPLFAVLVIPLFTGQQELYHWSIEGAIENDLLLSRKAEYFNGTFYLLRTVVVIALWALVSIAFYRWSVKQDTTKDARLSHKMRWWTPLAFVVFALSLTVAAIDWIMTLDGHWYSTIFGIYFFSGAAMAAAAAQILSAMSLQKSGVLKEEITTEHYHDLGKWMFAWMVFWAYTAFSQYVLIWYANKPEETFWYGIRLENGWEGLSSFLAISHFLVPLFFLMSRHMKRRKLPLALGAGWLLFAHYVDMFWLVQPALFPEQLSFHLTDILALVGIGGIIIGAYAWLTGRSATTPVGDPRIEESLQFENF